MAAELPVLLLADGTRVECRQRLRELPGKREVFAGERTGSSVVAKVYLDPRRADVHARREVAGLAAFAAAGVPAPELLYHGLDSASRPVVVVRDIAGAESLATCWQAAEAAQRASLIRDIMRLLAAQHEAGLWQNDLRLDKFLVADGKVYSIDGDVVERRRPPLDRHRSLRHLALFAAQFLPQIDALYLVETAHYAEIRGWSVTSLRDQLPHAIARARLRRWYAFREKLYRECPAIARRQTAAGACLVVRPHADRLAGLLDDPDTSCPRDTPQRLKNGNTATVWSVRSGGHELVVKRYNIKGRGHGLMRLIKESRASISWRNAHMLRMFGIQSPAPVGLCIRREALLRTVTYFLAERIDGISLRLWVEQHQEDPDQIRRMARKIGAVLAQLQRLQISHGDMKATNFIRCGDRLYLIDLDAMRLHRVRAVFRRAWRRDIRRFYANWKDQPGVLEIMQQEIGGAIDG